MYCEPIERNPQKRSPIKLEPFIEAQAHAFKTLIIAVMKPPTIVLSQKWLPISVNTDAIKK